VILSRLACSGIAASHVTLTGAEETVITREHELVTNDRLIDAATEFQKNNLPDPSICQIDPIRTPGQLVLPGEGDNIRLVCRRVNHGARNQCKVQVTVFDGSRQVGSKDVYFRFRYNVRKIVTKTAIAQGDVLSTENIGIETAISNYPEPPGWKAPYGLVTMRAIPANTVLSDNMVGSPQPEVLVKRNQSVSIKIENAGLIASAVGKALQDGVAGEYIKVQNVDSRIIIMAKINNDGTVEPVY
jgi:flagella basal body P-ring formation protein FlgA